MNAGAGRGWINPKRLDFEQDASVGVKEVQSQSTDPNLKNRHYSVIIKQDRDTTGSPPLVVVGAVPQSLQIMQNVDWKAPWGAGLAGDGMVGDLLAATQGNRLVAQVMTMQVWQGSGNDFDFTIEFELRAWSDPVRDVLDPLRALLRMSLPSLSSTGFLNSPGPVLSPEGVTALTKKIVSTGANVLTAGSNAYKNSQTSDGKGSLLGGLLEAGKVATDEVTSSGIAKKSLIEPFLKNKISIQVGGWFYMQNVLVTQVTHNIKAQTPDRASGIIQSASVAISFKPMFSITAEDVDAMLRVGGSSISPQN